MDNELSKTIMDDYAHVGYILGSLKKEQDEIDKKITYYQGRLDALNPLVELLQKQGL